MTRPLKIAITTGDSDGIGFEIVSKALYKMGPQKGVVFYLWRPREAAKKYLKLINSKFDRLSVATWPEALRAAPEGHKTLVDIVTSQSPALWVQEAAQAASFGHLDAIATAPLSKTAIRQAGLRDIGHTDILKRVSRTDRVAMAFVGKEFNVVLATGHKPIEKIAPLIDKETLRAAAELADEFRPYLPGAKSNKPLALLGLNPHAGESGMLGTEEQTIHAPLIDELCAEGISIVGPLVPDVAFLKENWNKYSIYIANYHDQGLIPYKLVHERRGVHLSLGLPFVRTSVDHGTAKDIFGKDKADSSSMLEAIKWAIQLSKKNSVPRGTR